MTPEYPKPSAHDLVIGRFYPNIIDTSNGFANPGFGVTTAILFDTECGSGAAGVESAASTKRGEYYTAFLAQFGYGPGPGIECKAILQPWPSGGGN